MKDKIFTDEEIVKALEICSGEQMYCTGCPLLGRCGRDSLLLEKEALALINRQKADAKQLAEEKRRLETQLEGANAILQIVAPEWFGKWFRGVLYLLHQNVEEKGGVE